MRWSCLRAGKFKLQTHTRLAKEEAVNDSKRILFGEASGRPGERHVQQPLDGRQLLTHYFPSKYAFQDFQLDEYFTMQATRFAKVDHPVFPELRRVQQRVYENREKLHAYFATCSAEAYADEPALKDLHGLLYAVDPRQNLPCPPGEERPLRLRDQDGEASVEYESTEAECYALLDAIQEHFVRTKFSEGMQEVQQAVLTCESVQDVRRTLYGVLDQRNILPPISRGTIGAGSEGNLDVTFRPALEINLAAKSAEAKETGTSEVDKFWQRTRQKRRWRFVDPLYRRRRVKFLERYARGQCKPKEIKYNEYRVQHPDNMAQWPSNKNSGTVKWPSPYH
jgi:hypothetical protein